MHCFRWLSILAAMLAGPGLTAHAQLVLPSDTNLFGDEIVRKLNEGRRVGVVVPMTDRGATAVPAKAEGLGHVLLFHDGRQLRGEVVQITRDEVVWRRPDVSEALRFPRAVVRRIVLAQSLNRRVVSVFGRTVAGSDKPVSATVKLPGGDWLFGDVTSADGKTIDVKLSAGMTCTIPRSQVEWLYFGPTPVPAFGFSGDALAMEGWLSSSASAWMEVADGTLTSRVAPWIGRSLSPTPRFEVAFEIPAESDDGLRLWLQPFGPQPNSYGTGTVELKFGRKEFTRLIYIDKFEHLSTPLPKEAQAEKRPVSYRVLFDGVGQRLVVVRNGRPLGDWKLRAEKDNAAGNRAAPQIRINGICFDNQEHDLRFNQLRVQPWDGVTPQEGDVAVAAERLSVGNAAPVAGTLESVTNSELIFSGEKMPRAGGTFVQFANATVPLVAADAMLAFGTRGELSVAGLEIRDGKVRCQTAFAPAFEVPATALQTVVFPQRPMAPPPPADALVFKNGDELSGTLLSAGQNTPLRWKTRNGQEVEFQVGRIAGVRLAGSQKVKADGKAATVELRNGERLRGELMALDETKLQWKHALLGPVVVDRSRLWHLYPNARLDVCDGGRDPLAWLGEAAEKSDAADRVPRGKSSPWIHLDGNYIQPPTGNDADYDGQSNGLQWVVRGECERLEVRCEVTQAGGSQPNFGVLLSAKGDAGSVRATVGYGNLQLYVNNPKLPNRQNWRNIPLRDKLADATTRTSLRVFVDTKIGTADFFLDGALAIRIGQDSNDRLPGLGQTVRFHPYASSEYPVVFSNLWIGPWNGELPRVGGDGAAATALANGDAVSGAPKELRDGKLLVGSEIGELELPVEKVQAVEFGGALQPEKSAGRIRLADGSAINVDTFRWDGHELVAHSATLGDLRLSAGAVSELIYDPAPAHAPRHPEPKKLVQTPTAPVAAKVLEEQELD